MNGLEQAAGWLTPLLLLPGVGMLIMSTSVRYGQLHDEIHHLLDHGAGSKEIGERHFLKRLRRFRRAFICLYAAVICLALSGLAGGAVAIATGAVHRAVLAVTGLGIALIVIAAVELCLEALMSADALYDAHLAELGDDD